MTILLLLASLSWGQSTGTVIQIGDSLEISNHGKAIAALESGRYTQTGLPKFLNGIQFADGTIQVTSATAGSGTASVTVASTTFLTNSLTISGTAFGVCYATASLTVAVGTATVTFQGYGNGGGSLNIQGNILINGQYVNIHTETGPAMNGTFCGGVTDCSFTISEDVNVAVAGVMSACIQLRVTGSSWTNYTGGGYQPVPSLSIRQ